VSGGGDHEVGARAGAGGQPGGSEAAGRQPAVAARSRRRAKILAPVLAGSDKGAPERPQITPASGAAASGSERPAQGRRLPPQAVVAIRPAAGLDDPEFRQYVAARGRSLLRIAYLLTRNAADAEDLLQSALAKTYQAWDRIEDRRAVDGYVRRTLVNTHISWWRQRRLDEYPTDEIPDRPVADPCNDSDLQDSVRRAIDRLPPRMRAAVLLRFYEDLTEAEIADRLGISLGTVKSTVSRAVAKLRTDADLLAH
jgi:RNA polymerase sigma-70 factor (sigma-E family)